MIYATQKITPGENIFNLIEISYMILQRLIILYEVL